MQKQLKKYGFARAVVRMLVLGSVSLTGLTLPQVASAAISGSPLEMKREVRTGEMGILDHNGRGLQCQLRAKALESRMSIESMPSHAPAKNAGGSTAVRAG
jgi:hypothetical protein